MLLRNRPGWFLPESAATPESVWMDRRRLLKGVAAGSILASGVGAFGSASASDTGVLDDPSASLYPVPRNEKWKDSRPLTDEDLATTYNNFYEFGSHKNIHKAAQALKIRPWTITIDGEVEKPITIGIDDLLKKVTLEERVYRHRCVEAWAMTVPWSGFPMRQLVEMAKPTSSAKYVVMQTFMNPEIAPGQKQHWYPWPYVEGLTMAEATHELTLMVTGLYGKPVPKQNGAPLRLVAPWKYGFKQIKSISRFTFSKTRPKSFWEELQASEYGFWANVNPEVPHPRWSQATERVLGENDRQPTELYNGYAEHVAHLYKDLQGEKLFM